MEKTTVTLNDVCEAAERIKPYVVRTKLIRQKTMDEKLGCKVYLKPEMLQITGAFKMRGAMNKDFISFTGRKRQRYYL